MKQLLKFILIGLIAALSIHLTSCSVTPPYNKPIIKSAKGNWVGGNAYKFYLRDILKARRDSINLSKN